MILFITLLSILTLSITIIIVIPIILVVLIGFSYDGNPLKGLVNILYCRIGGYHRKLHKKANMDSEDGYSVIKCNKCGYESVTITNITILPLQNTSTHHVNINNS